MLYIESTNEADDLLTKLLGEVPFLPKHVFIEHNSIRSTHARQNWKTFVSSSKMENVIRNNGAECSQFLIANRIFLSYKSSKFDTKKQPPVVFYVRPATLLKKRLWRWCFPVNFVKFLRTPFFTEHLQRLLLEVVTHKEDSSKNFQMSQEIRSSHRKCSGKIVVLKSFANFTGK